MKKKLSASIRNINKPAPKWFNILNRLFSPTENTIMLILLALGYTEHTLAMVVYKIVSGYLRSVLDIVLTEITSDQ